MKDLFRYLHLQRGLVQTEALSNPNWVLFPEQGKELLNSHSERENLVAEVEEREVTFIEPLTVAEV